MRIAASENLLANALLMLHGDVKEAMSSAEVIVVEFARSDLITALEEFDDIACGPACST
jgi:hypothetical protein